LNRTRASRTGDNDGYSHASIVFFVLHAIDQVRCRSDRGPRSPSKWKYSLARSGLDVTEPQWRNTMSMKRTNHSRDRPRHYRRPGRCAITNGTSVRICPGRATAEIECPVYTREGSLCLTPSSCENTPANSWRWRAIATTQRLRSTYTTFPRTLWRWHTAKIRCIVLTQSQRTQNKLYAGFAGA
jgi:hypothetical protein